MGYIKVEYLADGARVFNCNTQLQITRGSTENVQKMGVVAEIFSAKSAGRCSTPVMEIKPNRVSLR